MRPRPFEILLVEDNPADARLTQEALPGAGADIALRHLRRGEEALAYLRREGRFRQAPWPDLILLDLNLPGLGGHEVLAEIKADPVLRRIPVIVLSSSQAPEEIQRVYDLHGNAYVVKPVDLDRFLEAMRSVEAFWLRTARLPPEQEPPSGR